MAQSYLKTIRLNLARTPEHPEGSDQHFYRFTAPLTHDGHIDAEAWKKHRDKCRVVRSWGGIEEDIGHLVHRPGGSWAFHYDLEGDEGDESGFRLGDRHFAVGEYVTIRDENGVDQPMWVASVIDA